MTPEQIEATIKEHIKQFMDGASILSYAEWLEDVKALAAIRQMRALERIASVVDPHKGIITLPGVYP